MDLQVGWRFLNPIALRKSKIAYNFGLSESSRVKDSIWISQPLFICSSNLALKPQNSTQLNLQTAK